MRLDKDGVKMSKNVVLIIDMVKGFMEEGFPLFCAKEAKNIVEPVKDLLEEAQARSDTLIYACDNHRSDDLEFRMFPPHCIAGTVQTEIIDELKPFSGILVPKTRFSALFRNDLDKILLALNPEKITIVGVCTDICVMHTAADLRNRDYLVEIPQNCVASFDSEAHAFALRHMEKTLGVTIKHYDKKLKPER